MMKRVGLSIFYLAASMLLLNSCSDDTVATKKDGKVTSNDGAISVLDKSVTVGDTTTGDKDSAQADKGQSQTKDSLSQNDTLKMSNIRFGYQPLTHQLAYIVAQGKSWWQTDLSSLGITKITQTSYSTGGPEMEAMKKGEIDIAYVGAAPVLSAIANGLDAKIIAAVHTQGTDLVVKPDLTYTSPSSLKGVTIGTLGAGSVQDIILRNWLTTNKLTPGTDVTINNFDSASAATTAFYNGSNYAVFLPHPAPIAIINSSKGKVAVKSGTMLANHACCVVVASGKLIKEDPKIVEQIVKTHIKATNYIKNAAYLDENVGYMATQTGSKAEDIKASLNAWDGAFISDPNTIVNSVVDIAKIQLDMKVLSKELKKDDIFDLTFFEKASK